MTARTCRVFIATAALLLAGAAVAAPAAEAAKPKAPAAVSKPRVGAASSTAVTVSWTNPKSKRFASTIVRVAAGTKAPKSASAGRAVATVGKRKHAVSVSRLAPGTVYTVGLFASDGKKHNAKGVAVRIQTAPGAITALKATSTSSSISLTYRFSASRSANAVVVRYAKGATAPAYPTSGTGVSAGRSGVTVTGLAAQTRYTFSVWARDAARRYSPVARVSAGTKAGPTATSGAISGTVFGGGGSKTRLSGAMVYVFDADSTGDEEGFGVSTASDGSYLLYDLPVGRYGLCFTYDDTTTSAPAGYSPGCIEDPVQVTRGKTTTGHDVTLAPAAGFTGKVTGLSGTDLVQDVAVYGFDENDESAGEGYFGFGDEDGNTTDAAGKYTVTGLPASVTTLCFDAGEAEGLSETGYTDTCVQVSGAAGKINTENVTLKAAAAISGTVRGHTAGEDPLAGVAVVAIDADSTSEDGPDLSYSYSQKNGTYTVTGLTPGDHYYVCFDAIGVDAFDTNVRDGFVTACQTSAGLAPWDGDIDNLPTGTSTIVAPNPGVTTPQPAVTLELGGAVVGTVRDAKSLAVSAQVYVIDGAGQFIARDRVGSGDTTFRVAGLAAGNYKVCVYAEDERFASQCYENKAWSPDDEDEDGGAQLPAGLTIVPVSTGQPTTLEKDIVLVRS